MTAIFTFDTTHHAMWAEQLAMGLGLGAQVIPAPAAARAKCSLAIEVLAEDEQQLRDVLGENGIVFAVWDGRGPATPA